MIEYQVLRNLVLESLKKAPNTTHIVHLIENVKQLADKHDVFPTKEACEQNGVEDYCQYYGRKSLRPVDEKNLLHIIWDLIIDRVLTPGNDLFSPNLPFICLTEFGSAVINQEAPPYYDPQQYAALIKSFTGQSDSLIAQYVVEGLNCFRKNLLFAAAVMFGAAAERIALILLEAIGNAETNSQKKQKIEELLKNPNLPEIFKIIQDTMCRLKKTIPYDIHESSEQHLLSLFEMIRVQRNDAVHPNAGQVDRNKVFLTIQTFPAALEIIYRLVNWFSENRI